jgi:CheY-like chemotaxis protein
VKYTPYNLRVLIVDPNTHIRQLLRMMLQSDGAKTIYGSNNAVDGFDAYCGNEFNVVFTEFDMEPISGLDFAELIRKAPKSPNPYVPIIMLSAYSDVQRVQSLLPNRFLSAPWSRESKQSLRHRANLFEPVLILGQTVDAQSSTTIQVLNAASRGSHK